MQNNPIQYQQDLVLLGGGHSHVLLLQRWLKAAPKGLRITLVSEAALTPYSGMLPGYIAGHFSAEEIHIDLPDLCTRGGFRWIEAKALGIDLQSKRVILEDRPALCFDILSIDTGSTPNKSILGSQSHAIAVKPISKLRTQLEKLFEGLGDRAAPVEIAVVGGGAAGVEVAFALAHRLQAKARINLLYPQNELLKGYPEALISTVHRRLRKHGIAALANRRVVAIEADLLRCEDQQTVDFDFCFLCTPAAAPLWPEASGLSVGKRSFISVKPTLQSYSHDFVFAAGDVATMIDDPRPKAGVYAVRQAPILAENITRFYQGKPLQSVVLQRDFLSLLALGERYAVGSRYGLSFSGRWVWHWKKQIDRAFLAKFKPVLQQEATPMPCAGCASKLGPNTLNQTLSQLRTSYPQQFAAVELDDAARLDIAGQQYWQSLDGFRSFGDDLYLFGRIAAAHALSDIYAMGQQPQHAMVWATVAYNHPSIQQRDFEQLMQGVLSQLALNQVQLLGGHSTEGPEAQTGLAVGGIATKSSWGKKGGSAGDRIVLTKPIGSGVLLAALMQNKLSSAQRDALFALLQQSNRAAMQAATGLRVSAATDVTGFGLLGHLREMLSPGLGARLDLNKVPLMLGADQLAASGVQSTLSPALLAEAFRLSGFSQLDPVWQTLLCDPQTSGGLVLILCPAEATAYCEQYPAKVIGELIEDQSASVYFST